MVQKKNDLGTRQVSEVPSVKPATKKTEPIKLITGTQYKAIRDEREQENKRITRENQAILDRRSEARNRFLVNLTILVLIIVLIGGLMAIGLPAIRSILAGLEAGGSQLGNIIELGS